MNGWRLAELEFNALICCNGRRWAPCWGPLNCPGGRGRAMIFGLKIQETRKQSRAVVNKPYDAEGLIMPASMTQFTDSGNIQARVQRFAKLLAPVLCLSRQRPWEVSCLQNYL